jgi:hypothetical protein
VLSLLYEPSELYINVVTAPPSDRGLAEAKEFWLIPAEPGSEHLLSPLVISTSDFVDWLQDSNGVAVQRMSVPAEWLVQVAIRHQCLSDCGTSVRFCRSHCQN